MNERDSLGPKKLFRAHSLWGKISPQTKPFSSGKLLPKFVYILFWEKQEKQDKQGTFPTFENVTEGKMFGGFHIAVMKFWKIMAPTWMVRQNAIILEDEHRQGPY